ncbi:hypothetical protein RIR_e5643_jg26655.t1 [Rhizophagus irregularis DAOM 181602=DAOM 197198]|nr:hypothetical protein RIR_e5643_jg26655.t1 [Rhizophagus irregularis DAOM 181602=DAOM 197198]
MATSIPYEPKTVALLVIDSTSEMCVRLTAQCGAVISKKIS